MVGQCPSSMRVHFLIGKIGGIFCLSVFGQKMMIISDGKLAIEMLDKKSVKYSSRPTLPMGGELGAPASY